MENQAPLSPPDSTHGLSDQPEDSQETHHHHQQTRLQIINEHKEFTSQLGEYITDEWKLNSLGLQYNVVAVFGSQSTGKSTLLNRLFKTKFDVMDDKSRRQTTRGVWLSKALDENTLVFDVEGTDGRERGEDQEFERRSALFSMAVAQVIIINIWENMVGLYNGANMGLLKTVFEVNLQLFPNKESKTLLMVVIRDHIGTTPLENLKAVLIESLQSIWKEVNKPAGLENAEMGEFFDFDFAALPHKILQPDKFEFEVDVLRKRFVSSDRSDYAFLPRYHKNIPIDGFNIYTKSIWEKIIDSKDLDLPTQQELLAQYRCDEISASAFKEFTKLSQEYSLRIESGEVVMDFQSLGTIREKIVEIFSKEASRYHQEVYIRKRSELVDKMNSVLHVLFIGQLKNVRRKAVLDFKTAVQKIFSKQDEQFASKLTEVQNEAESFFVKLASDSKLKDTNWTFEEDVSAFKEELQELSFKIRSEEMEKLSKKLQKSTQKTLLELISDKFGDSPKDMWLQLLNEYKLILKEVTLKFEQKVSGFNASPEELDEKVMDLKNLLWDSFKNKINEETSDQLLQVRLRRKFEDCFRYTDDGLPRIWQEGENIEACFIKAKEEAENLIPLFAKIPLSEDCVDEIIAEDEDYDATSNSILLLSNSKQRDLRDRLKKDCDLIFMEVKRGAVASLAEVPRFMWILLLIFGFNEIYSLASYVMYNPLVLVLLVLLSGIGTFLYQSGLLVPAMKVGLKSAKPALKVMFSSAGPLLETGKTMIAESLRQASEKLDSSNGVELQKLPKTPRKKVQEDSE